MISYIVNLFMVQTHLKRDNRHSESLKKIFCVHGYAISLPTQETVSM